MAQQIINVGSAPNDGTGDTLRNSQIKSNANFTELYNADDLKLDKVTSSGVERAYIINADGSQSTKPTSDFSGSSVQSVTGDSVDNTDNLNPIINAIPLIGTTVGNPVSGNIEIKSEDFAIIEIFQNDLVNSFRNALQFNADSPSFRLISEGISDTSYVDLTSGSLSLYTSKATIEINTKDSFDGGRGLEGMQDYTPNITDLDYVQKKYVDTGLATKQNKFYSNKLTTPSPSVTGTLSETELVKITIPANTFSASDIIRLPTIMLTKVGVNNAATVRLKISTSATMPAGSTGQIAQFTVNATALYQNVNRTFYVEGGNLKGFPFTTAANTDIGLATSAMSTVAFDRTVTQYLYISGTLLSTADSLRIEGLQIMNS